mmetsp:Transcript_23842/g.38268  ORF Transcript_23842/g.38268 Transcript_23842/m.38268 type:complete len:396 (+) Transcript_23842:3-1190(+)
MSIYFNADGYADADCRAWFELELIDPIAYRDTLPLMKTNTEEVMDGIFENVLHNNNNDDDEKKTSDFESTLPQQIKTALSAKYRSDSEPIVLSPLSAGQTYIVRVKCVNTEGVTCSDFHAPIELKVPPSRPIISRHRALDGAVYLQYACPNYNFLPVVQPKYEIQAAPHHIQTAFTEQTQVRIDTLRNGWDYVFKVRSSNAYGQSEWSKPVKLHPLKQPAQPTALIAACGDRAISVFWSSLDNIAHEEIKGAWLVVSDPPTTEITSTTRQRAEFTALDNETHYRFQVVAKNDNYRIESDWTTPTKPAAKKDSDEYEKDKNSAIDMIMKVNRHKQKEINRQRAETERAARSSLPPQHVESHGTQDAQRTIGAGSVARNRDQILQQLSTIKAKKNKK